MDQEPQEVYERIPWETLEKQGSDRQWLLIAIAGAVALGALAYSFVKSQPMTTPPPEVEAIPVTVAAPGSVSPAPVGTVASPLVVAEADLYAINPERLIDRVAAHAEWFAVEYFTVDGSEQSRLTLGTLMPAGVPLPESPLGTQVFVDWVGTQVVSEVAPLAYEVEVVVRSLLSTEETGFVRQPTTILTIEITIGEDGLARVARPPIISTPSAITPLAMALTAVPAHISSEVESLHGPVVGGEPLADGRWRVVAMVAGADGVQRPATIIVP